MNIYITLDYELFMNNHTGSVEKCLVEPVKRLVEVADRHDVKFTFFVDAAYLYRLSQLKYEHEQINADFKEVCNNIQYLNEKGHDIELHFHPQWLYSDYADGKWTIDMEHYKLSDMEESYLQQTFADSKKLLDSLLDKPSVSYRAGGYSLSTYTGFKSLFKCNAIKIDSSVLRNAFCASKYQAYDYRRIPVDYIYKFEDDLCAKQETGDMLEASISTKLLNPLSYILYRIILKLRYTNNQAFGDGKPTSGGKHSVFSPKRINASIDHYEIFKLKSFLRKTGDLVVIGHPKNQSIDSINYLDQFISKAKAKHTFKTIRELVR